MAGEQGAIFDTNVLRLKAALGWDEIDEAIEAIKAIFRVHAIGVDHHDLARQLAGCYQLKIYDAVIWASALACGATRLYSEDIHHGLRISGLTLVDPFSEARLMTHLSAILASADDRPFAEIFDFEADGMAHPVLVEGEGPAVILMHEMPGFVPQFWRLARWMVAAGFTVYAPALYEKPGTPAGEAVKGKGLSGGFRAACISREIHLFAANSSSPVTAWLRALAREAHARSGGPGVGVVGLCLTGNFAWSLAVEPQVKAAVAGEPSLPFHDKGALALSDEEREALARREDFPVMALRFDGDPACRAARFDTLREVVGAQRLIERVMPDEAKNPHGNPFPHAVLTKDLVAKDGEPTFEAAREVLEFLSERLGLKTP